MITAVDTSVLLDVFTADPSYVTGSQDILRKCLQEGQLIVCDVVVAELRPCFETSESLLKALRMVDIDYSPLTEAAALLAGESWAAYRHAGGRRETLVPDFLVAAHARIEADRLLTRDRGFYKKWFKGLRVVEP